MFRIFFIIISILFASKTFAQKVPQSLEEITADLKAKKAAMDPFNQKKVKVDIESLGLDDLDKKKAEEKVIEPPPTPSDIAPGTLPVILPEVKPAEVVPTPAPERKEEKKEEKKEGIVSKIQHLIHKDKPEEKAAELAAPTKVEELKTAEMPKAVTVKKPTKSTQKYINSLKKKNLKKRLEIERLNKINEKRREAKLKKLNELREKYLIKIDENPGSESEESDEDYIAYDEDKIIPRKKEINPFISDELPALPILNRYRTGENLHIPIILNPTERIEILFTAISSGNVAFFNSAVKDVKNPNVKNKLGDTALTYSILIQKPALTASILAKGANPNMPNNLGYTPMDIAIELLDLKSLELLVRNRADINYLDAFGRTYLMHAARVGFLPAVEMFIMKGIDVNAMDNDGFTALSIAYRHKKEVIIRYLLKNGAKTWIEKPYDPEDQSLIKELENQWR